MSKGVLSVILAIALMSSPLSLAFAQEEEKQPVAEFIDVETLDPFYLFWYNLLQTWGELVANNLVNFLSFLIVVGVGYFIGQAVYKVSRKILRGVFKSKKLQTLGGVKEGEDLENSGWGQVTNLVPVTLKWFVYIYAFVISIDLLGFSEASSWLGVLWTYIPNIIAFIILISVGIIGSRIALKWMEDYKPDLFGREGKMQIIKSLVNVIIFAFIFGIGITQLGIGTEIIPILFWTILAGTMGIFIAIAVGLKELAKAWSVGEGLKHSGVSDGAEIKFANHEGIVKHGLNYMQLKESNGVKLIPYSKLSDEIIDVKKSGSENKND